MNRSVDTSTVDALRGDSESGTPESGTPESGTVGRAAIDRVVDFREWLAVADGDAMSDAERIELIAVLERVVGAAAATQARVTVAFADSVVDAARSAAVTRVKVAGDDTDGSGTAEDEGGPGDAGADAGTTSADPVGSRELERVVAKARRSAGSQVALARRMSPSRGDRCVGLARVLRDELPCTMAALTAGEIGEWAATCVARETAEVPVEVRREVDRRLAMLFATASVRDLTSAARRAVAELDAEAVIARMERAARSRRVSVRPLADGMARLSVLGPLAQVVAAYAALDRHSTSLLAGPCVDGDGVVVDEAAGRGRGAIMADTALARITGLAAGGGVPVAVHLVMTDRSLLGLGDPARSTEEPAHVSGCGPVPAAVARDLIREACGIGDAAAAEAAGVWLRRLFTSPGGRDLVALESRSRVFSGSLAQMLVLRDDRCRTPWCDAPIREKDHVVRWADSHETSLANGAGLCQRCNQTKESPGWRVRVTHTGLAAARGPDPLRRPGHTPDPERAAPGADQASPVADRAWTPPSNADPQPHTIDLTTPTGHTYISSAPPVLGHGWVSAGPARVDVRGLDPWWEDPSFEAWEAQLAPEMPQWLRDELPYIRAITWEPTDVPGWATAALSA